ncbi:hypothetical protein [Enterococcus hirae]|uniref:hypothetical protein n=1 Tax=Enterococcus hirae TaxID=1354 RepID=UPI0020068BCB|nr:hypothetical protein [Enterococcus hirae]MCK6145765.1 hypothetical protein [Enterococcus hirae]MCK6173480.1 hypothetical protein [Enterococcus hirae]
MTEIAEGRGFTKAEIDKQKKIVENAYKTMDSHATYPHGKNYKNATRIHEKEEEKLATMLRRPIKATDMEYSREELKAQKKLVAQLFSTYDAYSIHPHNDKARKAENDYLKAKWDLHIMKETNREIQDKRERTKIKHSPNNAEARIPESKQKTQSIVQEDRLSVDEEREFFKQKDSSLYETVETEVIDKLSPLESKKEEVHTKLSKLDEEIKNILNSIRERDEAKENFLDSYFEKLSLQSDAEQIDSKIKAIDQSFFRKIINFFTKEQAELRTELDTKKATINTMISKIEEAQTVYTRNENILNEVFSSNEIFEGWKEKCANIGATLNDLNQNYEIVKENIPKEVNREALTKKIENLQKNLEEVKGTVGGITQNLQKIDEYRKQEQSKDQQGFIRLISKAIDQTVIETVNQTNERREQNAKSKHLNERENIFTNQLSAELGNKNVRIEELNAPSLYQYLVHKSTELDMKVQNIFSSDFKQLYDLTIQERDKATHSVKNITQEITKIHKDWEKSTKKIINSDQPRVKRFLSRFTKKHIKAREKYTAKKSGLSTTFKDKIKELIERKRIETEKNEQAERIFIKARKEVDHVNNELADLKSQLKQLKNKYPTGEEQPKINNELAAQIKKSLKFIKEQQPKIKEQLGFWVMLELKDKEPSEKVDQSQKKSVDYQNPRILVTNAWNKELLKNNKNSTRQSQQVHNQTNQSIGREVHTL